MRSKPSLKDPWSEIHWAKEHLDALNASLRELQGSFRFVDQEDVQNALLIRRLQIPIIPPRLGLIAGDALFNLRAALDHTAWQLALTVRDKPSGTTAFPVLGKEPERPRDRERFDTIVQDIPAAAVAIIKELQPYQRGAAYKDDPLWKLDKLCNICKHRVIPAQGTAVEFKFVGDVPKFHRVGNEYVVVMPISAKGQRRHLPPPRADVEFGSEVDGCVISVRKLTEIYGYVRHSVLPRFAQFF